MEYGRTTMPDGRRNGFSTLQDDRRNDFSTLQDDRRNDFSTMRDDRRNDFSTMRDDRRNGFTTMQDDRRNGVIAGDYNGTPYIQVEPPEVPSARPGWFSNLWTIPSSYFSSFLGRTNTTARLEGGSTAGDIRAGIQRPPAYFRGQDSERPKRHESYYRSYADFESRGANGAHLGKVDNTAREIDDRQQYPARKEAHINDLEVSYREKVHIERLENRIKHFENGIKQLEDDFKAKTKSFYLEKMRADEFEKENREYKGTLQGLSREKMRADNLERENREYQGMLQGLSREKMRADNLERENREFQVKMKKKEQEVGELQLKLQGQANAFADLEVKNAELKKHQISLQEVRRENQELKSWKIEQEEKIEKDVSTAGLLDTKVSDLTTANGQLENKKQQLTNQVQEHTKRIQELRQQVSVLEVKIGAKDSEAQSLRERLREERDRSSKLSDVLQQKDIEIEELMQHAQDLEQQNLNLMAQVMTAENEARGRDDREPRDRALKAQFSALQAQVGSKELETVQSLKTRLREELKKTSDLSERLQQCDLEIDDLKHQIQDLERRDSESVEFLPLPKEYIGGESFLETEATPYLLDGAVQRVHEVAGIFSRLLMKAMEQGRIDGMAVARNNFVRSISLGKAAPLKYVLEAITCKLLFQGFEHECFDLQDSTSGFMDMEEQRMDNFREYKNLCSIENPEQLVLTEDNLFTHYCRTKLENLSAAIPEIESMVREIISRTFEHSFSSEDTSSDVATYLAAKLGATFVKLAVCVWQVHKLAFSFNPMARIFRVSQSEKFVEKYMESVIFQESESDEDEAMASVDISRVDFMVVPGFLINRIVVRSRVFVVTKPLSKAFWIPN